MNDTALRERLRAHLRDAGGARLDVDRFIQLGSATPAEVVDDVAGLLSWYRDEGALLGADLGELLGLRRPPVPRLEADPRGRRDELIRTLAAGLPATSTSGRAKVLAERAADYAATTWAHDRNRGEPSPGCAELFEMHQLAVVYRTRWPLAWRQLFKILHRTQ